MFALGALVKRNFFAVGDDAGVDVAVLAFDLLLHDGHAADGPAQPLKWEARRGGKMDVKAVTTAVNLHFRGLTVSNTPDTAKYDSMVPGPWTDVGE